MGMFDIVYCMYPLPGLGVVEDVFQSKDTPCQGLDSYEIRSDGTLWHQIYDVVDRSDSNAVDLGRMFGRCARENLRWDREYLSGRIGFYGDCHEGWVEFEAEFRSGTLQEVRKVPESGGEARPRLAIEPYGLDQARADEREACAQVVLDRAREAEKEKDQVLGLVLRTIARKIRNRVSQTTVSPRGR